MQIDTAGTYTLKYTAEDTCGNITEVTREVVAEQISYRTVLYTDGTFIINEKSTDQTANEALHGVATNVYDPLDATHNYVFSTSEIRPWHSVARNVLSVEVGSEIQPTSMAYWFSYFTHCESIDFSNIDTSGVTSMAYLFLQYGAYATNDTAFDFSSFDTSTVQNMERMFAECYKLKALDLSSFSTVSATNMGGMFSLCNELVSLTLTNFDTSKVTDMSNMFADCYKLQSLDLSSFDTSNVTLMQSMFEDCQAITSLDISNFDTRKVTKMQAMFLSCVELTSLILGNFDTARVTNMSEMFSDCTKLPTLDLSSFNTSNVTNMREMFYRCFVMRTIYASSNFVVTSVGSSTNMFGNMSTNLVGGAGTTWASSNPTDKTYAHIDGGTADPGYFTLKSA